jgi:hypothetical protein
MQWSLVIFTSALILSGCCPALEKKLIGEWKSGCSIDICTITTLKADHTFSERFDEKDLGDSYRGTWRVEGHQLVLHITWVDENLRDILNTEIRLIISDLRADSLVTTLANDPQKTTPWKRVQ